MKGFLYAAAAAALTLGALTASMPAQARISERTCMNAWNQCQAGSPAACATVEICERQGVTPWL